MNFKKLILLSTLAAAACFTQAVEAKGFKVNLYGASGLGLAGAGGAAIADDPTTIFINPASMTHLCGTQASVTAFGLFPNIKFHNDDSISVLQQPLSGGDGKTSDQTVPAGSLFITREMGCGLWAGLGVNGPFGLVTDYGNDWVGRYQAVRSTVLTVNINPSLAYRINDCWSIGVGFSAMYAHIKFTNQVDFGLIGFLSSVPDFLPEQEDGKVILKANGWGYGGNVGILYDMSPCTRFGASYRSQVYFDVKGKEEFKNPPYPLSLVFTDTRLKAKTTLPATASFTAFHQLNACWAVMGDVTWTGWHSLDKLNIEFENGQPEAVTTFKWRDTMRYAVGTTFSPNCCWIFRGGLSFETRVLHSKEYQSARVPNNDFWEFGLGAGYRMWECLKFDIGYNYAFFLNPRINKTSFDLPEDDLRGGLRGHWTADIHVLALQATYIY